MKGHDKRRAKGERLTNMCRSLLATILVLATSFSVSHSCAGERIDGFTKLPASDILQMRYTSTGCFHFFTYDLTFTRSNNPAVSIAAIRLELDGPDPKARYRDAERRELGKIMLSGGDLAGLEVLLNFYRTNTVTGCTTRDGIGISQVRDGKVIATEKFTDGSCGTRYVNGLLSIQEIIQRLPRRKE